MMMPALTRIFIIFQIVFSLPGMADQKNIYFTSSDYPPYYGKELLNYGPISEIVVEAFNLVGYEVNISFMPWALAEFEAKTGGKFDGWFPPWHSSERERFFIYSEPFYANLIGFYKQKRESIHFNTYDDLKKYSIGTVIAYLNPEGFDEAKLKVSAMPNDHMNMAKLCGNRLDLVLIDREVARYHLIHEQPECSEYLNWMAPPLEIKNLHVVISRKSKNAEKKIRDFNRGLKRLKQ